MVVELEPVLSGGNQSPLTAAGGSAAALEAVERAVELDLAEHGLDRDLALPVEVAAARCREHATHKRGHAAGPARPRAFAQARVGRHEDLDASPAICRIWRWCQ